MTNKNKFKRGILSGSTALSALAVVGGFAATAVVATPALAQDFTTGVLVGQVRNPEGASVTGGTATVVSNDQGFTRNVPIGADGSFRVPSLPTGTYTVTINAPGYQAVADPNVAVAAGTSNTWVFTVGAAGTTSTAGAAGGTGNEVVVIGRAIRANDFAQTTTGLLVDVDELSQTIPIGRNQTSLILLAPGTVAGDTGFGNLPSIGGATVAENSYYVNGLNTTDFRSFVGSSTVPFEFYESVDVQTGGYQAEFGRALGGFVNATTERGSNDFRGGAVLTYTPDSFQSDAPNTYAAYNQDDYSESGTATLFLSGPLIRDRAFFYGFYQPRFVEAEDTSLTSNLRTESRSRTPYWGGKLDLILAEGHRLEGTIFSDKSIQKNAYYNVRGDITGVIGGTVANSGQMDFEPNGRYAGGAVLGFGGLNYIGTYTGAFTDWFTLSASYGKNKNRFTQVPSPNIAVVTSTITGSTTTANGTLAGLINEQDTREVYRVDADLYLNNLFGDHHFRAGYDVEKLESEDDTRLSGSGYSYTTLMSASLNPNATGTRINRSFYSVSGTYKTEYTGFYIQDSWKLFNERLNLNLGIRNDSFENRGFDGEVFYKTKNNWGPRLGATFDVFGDRNTKLQAFWGRYYLPIATNTNIRLAGNEISYVQRLAYAPGTNPRVVGFNELGLPNNLVFDEFGNPVTAGLFPGQNAVACPSVGPNAGELCNSVTSDGIPGPADSLRDANLEPSSADEMIFGLTHRMGDWTAGLQYINRRLGSTLDDLAIDHAVQKYCDTLGIENCGTVFSGFHQYVLDNPGTDMTVRLDGGSDPNGTGFCNGTLDDGIEDERLCQVVTLSAEDLQFPKAVRKYDSVQFSVNRRWDDVWSFNGSYTWTKLRGNYEGAVTSDQNQSDAGLTQDFDQPGLLEGRFGDLPNLRKHQFKAYAAMQLTPWMRVGVNATLASPRKFSCFGRYRNQPYQLVNENGVEARFAEGIYGADSHWCTQPRFANNNAGVYTPAVLPNSLYTDYVPTSTTYLVPRGSAFEGDWLKNVDLRFAFALPGLENSEFAVDIFNVFNFRTRQDFQEFGDLERQEGVNQRYGQVLGYQAPRGVRFTLGLRFGPGFHSEDEGEESVTQGR